jgi:dipeptidyl-peptidase-3
MGNYHSFGNAKFIPELEKELFHRILLANPQGGLYRTYLDRLWPLIEPEVYVMEKPFASIGLPHEGGLSAYFNPDMTAEELTLVREFLAAQNISPLNTRAFRVAEGRYEITIGSIEADSKEVEF